PISYKRNEPNCFGYTICTSVSIDLIIPCEFSICLLQELSKKVKLVTHTAHPCQKSSDHHKNVQKTSPKGEPS
ncbi:unnamed protein product, partial [Callosobruchus maculatus]